MWFSRIVASLGPFVSPGLGFLTYLQDLFTPPRQPCGNVTAIRDPNDANTVNYFVKNGIHLNDKFTFIGEVHSFIHYSDPKDPRVRKEGPRFQLELCLPEGVSGDTEYGYFNQLSFLAEIQSADDVLFPDYMLRSVIPAIDRNYRQEYRHAIVFYSERYELVRVGQRVLVTASLKQTFSDRELVRAYYLTIRNIRDIPHLT